MTTTAKRFMTGRSQAVLLPLELRFEGREVIAKRFGGGVFCLNMDAPWGGTRGEAMRLGPLRE